MSETDKVTVGEAMPRLGLATPAEGLSIVIEWVDGSRLGRREIVDLAPDVLTYRFYRPLRSDPDLFATLHLVDDGAAIAWGEDESIDMPATAIERLVEETMFAADFNSFLKRNQLTFDAAAAQLGISRRLIAYYAAGQTIPRHIALACERLDQVLAPLVPPYSPFVETPHVQRSIRPSSSSLLALQRLERSPTLWEYNQDQRSIVGDEQPTRPNTIRATRTDLSGGYLQ